MEIKRVHIYNAEHVSSKLRNSIFQIMSTRYCIFDEKSKHKICKIKTGKTRMDRTCTRFCCPTDSDTRCQTYFAKFGPQLTIMIYAHYVNQECSSHNAHFSFENTRPRTFYFHYYVLFPPFILLSK